MTELVEIIALGVAGVAVVLYLISHFMSVVALLAGARPDGRGERVWAAWVTVTTALGLVLLVGSIVREAIR